MYKLNNLPNPLQTKRRSLRSVTTLSRLMLFLKIGRFWCDGDGLSMNWNYWNPFSYPFMIVITLLCVIMSGVIETYQNKSDIGFGLSNYWKKYKDERIFVNYSDYLDAKSFWKEQGDK